MKHFIIGLFIAFVFSAVVNVSYAAQTRPYMYRVQQTQQLQELINRGSVPVLYETVATTPQGQQVTRYTTRSTALTKARIGSLARSAVGGPAILAATAAFVAYDYFYDEGTDTWTTQPVVLDDDTAPDGTAFCMQVSFQWANCSSTRYGVAQKYAAQLSPPGLPQCTVVTSTTGGTYGYGRFNVSSNPDCSGGVTNQPIGRPAAPVGFVPDGPAVQPGESLTDSDLGDAILAAPPQTLTDILNDPISTGTWPDRWPELLPNIQDIEDQLGHDIEGAPAPANPDQTITDGSTVAPPQTDTGSGGSMSSEWPGFCSWAGVVCDFIDWVQEPFEEPAPVEVPYAEIDFEEDYNSGIGIPNCPAPISIVTQFGEVQFDWTNTCSLADMVRPLVIAFSYLIGIYILLRVK